MSASSATLWWQGWRQYLRRGVIALMLLCASVGLVSVIINVWMVLATRHAIYSNVAGVPHRRVGLLLGTSPRTVNGGKNPFFANRVEAAIRLYRAGRVRRLLVSGANPSRYYNEPRAMYRALRAAGIPRRAITLDFAGYRTLDSVVRAKEVFGQKRLLIISQRSHDYRALFVAWKNGIDAIAYAAPEVDLDQSLYVRAREFLARVRAVLDIYVLRTSPRFLGPDVSIAPPVDGHDVRENGRAPAP